MIDRDNLIWSFMAKTLKNNDLIQDAYNSILLFINRNSFLKEVERRMSLSIFDVESLAASLPFCPIERIADTNFYGHAHAIKKYAGIEKLGYSIEHGLYFDEYIMPASFWNATKKLITINKEREDLIRSKVGKPVFAIGPYIHYVESLLSDDEILEIKKQYGRVLLVFPSHSCVELMSSYNDRLFIDNIKKLADKNNFDTVFINMFYYDILHHDYLEAYRNAGFKVVTAGHRYDLNFIRRLKSLIKISDYTVGNSVGTHIGYCLYMGKPHHIIGSYKMEIIESAQYRKIYDTFCKYSEQITSEQYRIVSYYWGFDCVKSKEEMHKLLKQ